MVNFPPLREKLHIQQFLGCANWLQGYLPAEYGHAAKVLGQWQKPGLNSPRAAWVQASRLVVRDYASMGGTTLAEGIYSPTTSLEGLRVLLSLFV